MAEGDGGPGTDPAARTDGAPAARPIDPGVDIGHVHLKVADIDRALDFYCGVLGFELMQRFGPEAAFISAGGYHHHIGLNTWQSRGGSPPAAGTTGLFHLAIRYPTRASLADALRRLVEARVPLEGASDHGVSEALYLADPDGNGVELYWDRPREDWPAPQGDEKVHMYTRPLDLDALIVEGVSEVSGDIDPESSEGRGVGA
jgi:catechol 2,3-dioxygenase